MQYGLTTTSGNKTEVTNVDGFKSPTPTFKAPQDPLKVYQPEVRDHSPSPSLVERARLEGKDHIAQLLAQAQQAAKDQAKVIERDKKPRVSAPKKKDTLSPTPQEAKPAAPIVTFTSDDVCDDVTFIKRTRGINPSEPSAKALFYANGGEKYLTPGTSFAQAFEAMRRAILHRLTLPKGIDIANAAPYQRHMAMTENARVYVPGVPTAKELARKANAKAEAKKRRATAAWMATPVVTPRKSH